MATTPLIQYLELLPDSDEWIRIERIFPYSWPCAYSVINDQKYTMWVGGYIFIEKKNKFAKWIPHKLKRMAYHVYRHNTRFYWQAYRS